MLRYVVQMFGLSLLLTLMIESLVCWIWKIRDGKCIVLMLLVNLLTNPMAVFVVWVGDFYLSYHTAFYLQIAVEIVVILIEAMIYFIFSKKESYCFSYPVCFAITANLISWLSGLLIQYIR